MMVSLAGPEIQILSSKMSNKHVLGVYEGKFRIFIGNCIGACEVISLFLALRSFRKKFASRFIGITHFPGNLAVTRWQHWAI